MQFDDRTSNRSPSQPAAQDQPGEQPTSNPPRKAPSPGSIRAAADATAPASGAVPRSLGNHPTTAIEQMMRAASDPVSGRYGINLFIPSYAAARDGADRNPSSRDKPLNLSQETKYTDAELFEWMFPGLPKAPQSVGGATTNGVRDGAKAISKDEVKLPRPLGVSGPRSDPPK